MPAQQSEAHKITEQLYAMLKSIGQFDEIEVRPLVNGLVVPDEKAQCFLGIYHRAAGNVASLMRLNNRQDFQAAAMVTRSMFELAVDIRLLNIIPDGVAKMISFSEVEKLRCARKIVKFTAGHPHAQVGPKNYASYIAAEGSRIDANKATLWPGLKRIEHWSGEKLFERVMRLGSPFEEIYAVEYPRLSWYVHAGLTGISGLKADTFFALCGVALNSSATSYEQILLAMIDEFKIGKADDRIRDKLKAARLLPFAGNQAEAERLYRQLVG
jgi:hypothetical protein